MGLSRFYRVLLGFTGFYWVLLGFTGFYLVLPSFTGFYWVLLGFTGFHSLPLGFDLVRQGFTGFYLVLLWVLIRCRVFFASFSRFVPSFTEFLTIITRFLAPYPPPAIGFRWGSWDPREGGGGLGSAPPSLPPLLPPFAFVKEVGTVGEIQYAEQKSRAKERLDRQVLFHFLSLSLSLSLFIRFLSMIR